MGNICGVKFRDSGKIYYFKADGFDLKKNITVVVDTEKGEQFAKVAETHVTMLKHFDIDSMKSIIRISSKNDYNKYLKNLKDAAEALSFSRKLVKDKKLDMRLLDASFTLDKKQLTINFIADSRIDFRDLVKEIAAKYKTRIELHQLGVRDKSREIGGLGQCGRELCCSKFLNGIETISINMAKNQNIALNPSKINGACGRLLCCLSYEDEVYSEHRSYLPKMGDVIKTKDGSGKVVYLDVLNNKYTVLIDGDRKEYELDRDK